MKPFRSSENKYSIVKEEDHDEEESNKSIDVSTLSPPSSTVVSVVLSRIEENKEEKDESSCAYVQEKERTTMKVTYSPKYITERIDVRAIAMYVVESKERTYWIESRLKLLDAWQLDPNCIHEPYYCICFSPTNDKHEAMYTQKPSDEYKWILLGYDNNKVSIPTEWMLRFMVLAYMKNWEIDFSIEVHTVPYIFGCHGSQVETISLKRPHYSRFSETCKPREEWIAQDMYKIIQTARKQNVTKVAIIVGLFFMCVLFTLFVALTITTNSCTH